MTKTIPTNNAGGPYNDEQAKHVRPEHDARRFNGPYVISDKEDWPCEQHEVIFEKDDSGQVTHVGHVCPCGCEAFRMLPVNGHKQSNNGAGWGYSLDEQGRLTMTPSILDTGKCHSHYFLRNGMVEWC